MAEDLEEDFEEAEAGAEPAKKGGGKKKLLLFIILPILLVVGGGAAAYFSGILDSVLKPSGEGESKEARPAQPAAGGEKRAGEVQASVFYDLPEMLVNLNSNGRKQSFLKIRVSLELENALDVSKVEQVMPRIVDNFQVYLRELRIEDLQGSAGMLRLREELLTRVNASVRPAKVNDVLFKEMLVQ